MFRRVFSIFNNLIVSRREWTSNVSNIPDTSIYLNQNKTTTKTKQNNNQSNKHMNK